MTVLSHLFGFFVGENAENAIECLKFLFLLALFVGNIYRIDVVYIMLNFVKSCCKQSFYLFLQNFIRHKITSSIIISRSLKNMNSAISSLFYRQYIYLVFHILPERILHMSAIFFAADIVFIKEIQFCFCAADKLLSFKIACFTSSADTVSKYLFDRYLYKSVISLYSLKKAQLPTTNANEPKL